MEMQQIMEVAGAIGYFSKLSISWFSDSFPMVYTTLRARWKRSAKLQKWKNKATNDGMAAG
jgi:hypothetical protein